MGREDAALVVTGRNFFPGTSVVVGGRVRNKPEDGLLLQSQHGFQVLAARHGREALDLAEQHVGDIDLLLTDVIMPHMGGFELAERFREIRPDAKVVMMSGYTQGNVIPLGVADGTTPFIQKPFETQQLMRTVQRALDDS